MHTCCAFTRWIRPPNSIGWWWKWPLHRLKLIPLWKFACKLLWMQNGNCFMLAGVVDVFQFVTIRSALFQCFFLIKSTFFLLICAFGASEKFYTILMHWHASRHTAKSCHHVEIAWLWDWGSEAEWIWSKGNIHCSVVNAIVAHVQAISYWHSQIFLPPLRSFVCLAAVEKWHSVIE